MQKRKSSRRKKTQASTNWQGFGSKPYSRSAVRLTPQLSTGERKNARGLDADTQSMRRPSRHQFLAGIKLERLKLTELWLREEIRASRNIILETMKWGLAVLTAVHGFLYYVRRDVATRMFETHTLPSYGTVPPTRWIVGTLFLTMIACLFCTIMRYAVKRHVSYRRQLIDMRSYSEIREGPTGGKINFMYYYLFFAFPVFDIVLWFYFRAISSITISW